MAQEQKIVSIPIFKRFQHGDYTVTPFQVFKRYVISDSTYSSSYGMNSFTALYPKAYDQPLNLLAPSSSNYQRALPNQLFDPKILWYSLSNMFYGTKKGDVDYNVHAFGMEPQLYGTASVFSIPTMRVGEGIKPGSFSIDDYSVYDGTEASIIKVRDDGYGNLYDSNISTASFVNTDYLMMYVGFNEHFVDIGSPKIHSVIVDDASKKDNDGVATNVTYEHGVYMSGLPLSSSGTQAVFNSEAYVRIPHIRDYIIDKRDDYAISFWMTAPSSSTAQSDGVSRYGVNSVTSLVSKQTIRNGETYSVLDKTSSFGIVDSPASVWPFRIDYKQDASGSDVYFSRKAEHGAEYIISTSNAIPVGVPVHVVCQKSGSLMQIYVNGTLTGSIGSVPTSSNVTNANDILVGAYTRTSGRFSGSLDEIRMYRKPLTSAEVQSLSSNAFMSASMYQTNRIGNVFYKRGIAVVSDMRPKYKYVFMGDGGGYNFNTDNGFSGHVNGVVTVHEHEVVCKIRESEFNFTMNPSIKATHDRDDDRLQSFVTGSEFTPYVTTVGLYNDRYELLAVAKLASAIPKRNDVDLNIIIRWDM